MERNIQRLGLINWLTLLLVAAAMELVSVYAVSAAGQVAVVFLVVGFLVAALSYFQMRLEAAERREKLEFQELSKAPPGSDLFASTAADTFLAQRSREQFERYFLPGFTILLFLGQAAAVYSLWRWLPKAPSPIVGRVTIAMALDALFALVLFLLGKYSAGLARLEGQRLLRPAAGYMLLGSFLCFVAALAQAGTWFEFARLDWQVARGICVVLGLAAVETLINLVLEIYRPRVKGKGARLLYESRLIGLLGQPGGIVTTLAQALDYQFGFKVSETWFYQFLEKALAWIILLQLGVLFLSTTFVIIETDERGLLEHFGQPPATGGLLQPGLHFKWPWPIDKVYRHRTESIQSFEVGFKEDPALEAGRTVLWTKAHMKDEVNMLVASREGNNDSSGGSANSEQAVPVNLITATIPVEYVINDFNAWTYRYSDAGELLEKIATREVVCYFVNVDIDELMCAGRLAASETLRQRIQARADQYKLGVRILLVSLEHLHPPVKVADAYEMAIGALQERETNILAAESYAVDFIPYSHAAATNAVLVAEAERLGRSVGAAAEANQFTNRLAAYAASPSVYTQRAYLETLARAILPTRKYVLAATNTHDVVILDLEEKFDRSLLNDVTAPPPGKK